MEKKLIILLVLALCLVSFFFFQSNKNQKSESKKLEEYQESNDALEKKNEELNARISELQKTSSGNSRNKESEESELPENDDVEALIKNFMKAQYEYSNEDDRAVNIRPYVTEDMLGLFVGEASEASESENQVSFVSHVLLVDVYRMDITESGGRAIVYVETTYQVATSDAISIDMLINIDLEVSEDGEYVVKDQSISVLQDTEN